MASLKALLNKSAEVAVEFEGLTINLRYALHRYSAKFHAQLSEAQGLDSAIVILRELVIGWDIEDEKGKPLEISEEVLSTLPIKLVLAMAQAIMAEVVGQGNAQS